MNKYRNIPKKMSLKDDIIFYCYLELNKLSSQIADFFYEL